MGGQGSGILSLLGLVILAALFMVCRRLFPSLSTLILVVLGIACVLVVLLVIIVMFAAFRKNKDQKLDPKAVTLNSSLNKGRTYNMEIRRHNMKIKDKEIRTETEKVSSLVEKILTTLREQKDDISKARQFFNYYLPTICKILDKYVRLEESGVLTDDVRNSTLTCLLDIQRALEKQYQSLFDNDTVDLTVDMEALTLICKKDGLLDDKDFQ